MEDSKEKDVTLLREADTMVVLLTHNFDGARFRWLYAKYASGCNPTHHCTNAIRGRYSRRFTRLSSEFRPGQTIALDEFPTDTWDAIYICGVSADGYSRHTNYPHNVHVAILPRSGATDTWLFENWTMSVENGVFERVISEGELNSKYKSLPREFVTCRMFRWAVWHYRHQLGDDE